MSELLSTVMAIAITLAVCFFMVKSQVKFDEEQEKKEAGKMKRLKFWLEKCAQSRKNDQDL